MITYTEFEKNPNIIKPNEKGEINAPILKDENSALVKISSEGKTALTKYSLVKRYSNCSLIVFPL